MPRVRGRSVLLGAEQANAQPRPRQHEGLLKHERSATAQGDGARDEPRRELTQGDEDANPEGEDHPGAGPEPERQRRAA